MTIDPQNLTLLCLNAKDHELDESSNVLIHKLTGNPANDDPIRLELGNITAERFAIAARRAAILGGGNFTPPEPADVNALQSAIADVHNAVVSSADVVTMMGLTAKLLSQYGAAKSH
jgi:hypothetical protein